MSMTTMKHVGVNVAADPLFTAAYMGLPGGFVLVSADDPLCHSSQDEQDNRTYARFMGMPCFEPATAQEAKDMTANACCWPENSSSRSCCVRPPASTTCAARSLSERSANRPPSCL